MRLLFFGDGPWATQSLKCLAHDGILLLGVVIRNNPSDPELPLVAASMGLPVFQPKKVNSVNFLHQVKGLSPDLNISVSYDQIIKKPLLESAPGGFLNFHAGKLPYYRGRSVLNWALINGESEIGLTAHYMDEGIDTGDIVLQKTLPVSWTDTYAEVLQATISAFPGLVSEAVKLISSGISGRIPQSHLHGTYFAARGPGDEILNWSDTSRNIYNKIRAITRPAPGALTFLNKQPVIVWRAFYDPTWPNYISTPGQVVGNHPGRGVLVKTGDSTLLIQEVQIGDGNPGIPAWPIRTRLDVNHPI